MPFPNRSPRTVRSFCRGGLLFPAALICALSVLSSPPSVEGGGVPADKRTPQKAQVVRAYPKANLLVSPPALAEHLGDEGLIVIDGRSKARYLLGHIEGAVHIGGGCGGPLVEALDGVPCMLVQAERSAAVFAAAGVTLNRNVVVYGDDSSWGAEGRLFWILEMLGHRRVRLLDGGYGEWKRLDLPTARWPTKASREKAFGPSPRYTTDFGATTEGLADALRSNRATVVDNRTTEEYGGAVLYDEARGGHIPGSAFVPWTDFLDDDYRFKPAGVIEALLVERGVPVGEKARLETTIVTLCTGGIRSGFGYFALRLMGYEKVKNYDGSWWAWAGRADLPVEK